MSESHSTEVWKEIDGFPGYDVSNHGRVRSWYSRGCRDRWMSEPTLLTLTKKGKHCIVGMRNGLGQSIHFVHRLVLVAFVGERPPGMQCRHLDGDGTNNHVENLRWGTDAENKRDRVRLKEMPRGSNGPAARLTEEEVREIRRLREEGRSCESLARQFGTTRSNIGLICQRLTWADT